MELRPSNDEIEYRARFFQRVLRSILHNEVLKLPPFDGRACPSQVALLGILDQPNELGGVVDGFRYQIEGEEDLLHVFIAKRDSTILSVDDARSVLDFLFPELVPSLVWLKPGTITQHFYFGHELLLES